MADESEAVVRISKNKETELEFQVKVQGTEDLRAETIVRFVIAKVDGTHDLVFHATRGTDNDWKVVLPPLAHIQGDSYDVRIEVIIDNYYFEPAHGKIMLLSEPRIILTMPHESKKVERAEKEEKVEERQGGAGTSGDMSAPTTTLLRTEHPPKTSHRQDTPDDESIDKDKLFDVKPGESIQEPQDDGKDDDEDEDSDEFNPQRVAEQIIMDTLGLSKRQRQQVAAKPGYLFKRDAEGKPVVAALSDPEIKRRLQERQKTAKEEKVKAILRDLAK
jgi:hypothetical protein